jgi:hypothetical protein
MDIFDEFGVFYEGHVVVKLQDYRMTIDGTSETRHVVLNHTTRSRIADAQLLGEKMLQDVADQTVLEIESKLLVGYTRRNPII